MAYGTALKSCELRIKCKAGTLASGADSVNTVSFSGCNQSASAETLLNFVDAIQSLRSVPLLEVIRRDDVLVSDEL